MAVNEDIDLDQIITTVAKAAPPDQPLERLATAHTDAGRLANLAQHLVAHYVDEARRSGASWTDIGAALGVTRQAAQQRFVPLPRNDLETVTDGTELPLGARAIGALRGAQRLAEELDHATIEDVHLLLALLDSRSSGAINTIKAAGCRPGDVRKAAKPLLSSEGTRKPSDTPVFGRVGSRTVEVACREALRLRSADIRTQHILLALATDTAAPAGRALQEAGAHYDLLRSHV